MKAIVAEQLGGPEVLQVTEIPKPSPAAGEVVIRVEAASVNYADTMQRRGVYPGGPQPPFIPGLEVAGHVVERGEGVHAPEPGQRVMAFVGRNGYAEFVTAAAPLLMPAPEGFSAEEAAAFPIVFATAYYALKVFGHLRSGESVLVHAAGGGVGTAAVQLAKELGARVLATASSDEKLQRVKELGADVVINYAQQDFAEVVRDSTDGRGVDVILEMVGGDVFEKSVGVLAPFGRLLTYGLAGGQLSSVSNRQLILNNISVTGVNLNLIARTPDRLGSDMAELLKLIRGTHIRPIIGHTFELKQAGEAHRLLESRGSFGKIVLIPSGQ